MKFCWEILSLYIIILIIITTVLIIIFFPKYIIKQIHMNFIKPVVFNDRLVGFDHDADIGVTVYILYCGFIC